MPCFSASNVRFQDVTEQLQQKCKELKLEQARSKSAMRFPPDAKRQHQPRMSFKPFHRQCEQVRGYDSKEIRYAQVSLKKALKPKEVFLQPQHLQRLKECSKIVTVEERLKELQRQEEENRRLTEEAERLRLYFKEMDDERNAKEQAESDEQNKTDKLDDKAMVLNRLFLARQEQEEEVKIVNRLIMDAKCHAVRDAQIQEKQMIAEELKKDERRLQMMVNDRAKSALSKEDADEQKNLIKRAQYAKDIRKQLFERENMRFLEAERIEEEAKFARRANELIKQEEERQRELINERKRKFREELERLKEISAVFKKMLCEQERMADMRIVAYMKEKREQEQKIKDEKRIAKQEFERRQQTIYILAEKKLLRKSANDEMAYIREQDRLDREYRAKEKAAAIRKQEIERELLESRAKQAEDTKQRLALQIAKAEQDFNTLMQGLKEEEAKQKQLDKEREIRRNNYRRDIMQQMNDKEFERRRLVELERLRTLEWQENERQRESNIKSVINAKIRDMRENCLPDRYVKDVEKQLNKIQANKNRIFR